MHLSTWVLVLSAGIKRVNLAVKRVILSEIIIKFSYICCAEFGA